MEEKTDFVSESLRIEGLIARSDSDRGVIVTHPHPLYGGDMHHPVVKTLAAAYRENHYTTLRFNFRGTGNSQGTFDNGRGEQADVCAAIACLHGMGVRRVDLAGYSFGAWVNAHLDRETAGYQRMIMVSPPLALIGFAAVDALPGLALVVTGDDDEIAPAAMIARHLDAWNPGARFEVVSGADHFYTGRLDRLASLLPAAIARITP